MFERTPHFDPAALASTEALLVEAREARERGHGSACVDALERALAVALEGETGSRLDVISWRLSKAHFDFGDPRRTLECLGAVCERGDPFEAYPQGLRAVERIVRHYWDNVGYASEIPRILLTAAEQTYRSREEPYLASRMLVQRAWQHACRGDLDELGALLATTDALSPKSFRGGSHRHPDAPDGPSSVWWVQMDVARTALRAGTWSGDVALAWRAYQSLEDAVEEAELDREGLFWFLEPVVHAGLDFAWRETTGYIEAYEQNIERLDGSRAGFHRLLGVGVLAAARGATETARRALTEASTAATAHSLGPEWRIDALRRLAKVTADPTASEQMRALVREYGVTVFPEARVGADQTSMTGA